LGKLRMSTVKKWCSYRVLDIFENFPEERATIVREKRSILILDDISGGKELVKIPVINDVDDACPPAISYTTEFTGMDSPSVKEIFEELKKESPAFYRQSVACGISLLEGTWPGGYSWDPIHLQNVGNEYYTSAGGLRGAQLKAFTPLGICECLASPCPHCKKDNRRVAQGLRLPLEVFRTKYCGWGVRCRVAIPEGSFILSYCGEVKTETEAASSGDASPEFLYMLDHYFARLVDLNDS
jgi:hypothetical protein